MLLASSSFIILWEEFTISLPLDGLSKGNKCIYIYIYIWRLENKKKKKRNKEREFRKPTRARSFFKLRNTLCFLIDRRSAMSFGNSRTCSTASAMYPTFPCWKFLIEASAGKGAPSKTRAAIQARVPTWESPLLSTRVCVTLACLAPF